MFRQKRGLSDVVTVTLIILLAIAAVAIVWAFVRSTLEETGKQITGACITTSAKLIGTCLASDGGVTVRNDGRQDTIEGIKLIYYETTADDSQSVTRDADCTNIAPLAQQRCTPQDPDGTGPQTAVPDFDSVTAGNQIARVGSAAVVGGVVCPVSTETAVCA